MSAAPIPDPRAIPTLRLLNVRRAVRKVYPGAIEHINGTTFDLPDGSVLSRRLDGGWTLLAADGGASIQLRTLSQLDAALQQRVLVIPAPLLPILEEIATARGGVLGGISFDWIARLQDAERLGLVERVATTAWRLTALGEEAAEAHRSAAFVAVCVRRGVQP